jgi:hypothetical protein
VDPDKKLLSKLVRAMKNTEQDPLRPLIDEYLVKRERRDLRSKRLKEYRVPLLPDVRPGGRLSPSAICGCKRLAAFKYAGVQGDERIDPDTELIFDDGNWRHHRWQATFLDMEALLGRERIRVLGIEDRVGDERLHIAGSLDVLLAIKVRRGNGMVWEKYLIDIKGINTYGFSRITMDNAAKSEHVRQVITYCKLRQIRRGLLLYENKNSNEIRVFQVPFNQKLWQEVEDWSLEVLDALEHKRLPPMHPECEGGTYLWEKCPYRRLCYGMEPAEARRETYVHFKGVDEAWAAGHEDWEERG